MTSVTSPALTGNATPSANAASGSSGAAAAATFAGGDFQTFLKMLTTQIKHQDPLNPMEGSDFAVQLATFSGVEQQVRTNQLLEQIAGVRSQGLGALAGWIGKEVRTTGGVAFDGQPITLDVRPHAAANRVELVTLDERGREVLREDIGPGTGEVDWAGRTADGPLPAATYRFRLVSYRDADTLSTTPVGAYARVVGAELTAEGMRLSLANGASALESEVTALREPR